jgi:hypothetical protein
MAVGHPRRQRRRPMGTTNRPPPPSHRTSHPRPLAGPEDDVITNMAQLLVQLAKLTPLGYNKLRDTDPHQALALLAEGGQLVETLTKDAERRRKTGKPSSGGFDDLRPIQPDEALRQRESGSS